MDLELIQARRDKELEDAERQETLEAIKEVGDKVKRAVEFSTLKTILHDKTTAREVNVTNDLATPNDISRVVSAIDELSVALKPESIEFQPVIEALAQLGSKLDDLPKSLPEVPKPLGKISVTNLGELKEYLGPLTKSINSLKLNPTFDPKIEVKPPDVNITTEKVDLSSLENLLQEQGKPRQERFDFTEYQAQDIDNSEGGMQYVGLETSTGDWCFIENDVEGNSLRYFFGSKNYSKEWDNHVARPFRILSEALNAVQT